ncbi:hypothetical protein GN956_G26787, partial [Arapaima gigas]
MTLRRTTAFAFSLLLFPCPATGVTFDQPAFLTHRVKDQVEIPCSHDDSNLKVMLWYRQAKNSTAVALIAYGYSGVTPNYENNFSTRFEMT